MTALPAKTVIVSGVTCTAQAVDQVVITFGRQTVAEDCSPATCQIRFLRESVTWTLAIGDDVEVYAPDFSLSPGECRFLGSVTSVVWSDYFVDIVATSLAFGFLARTRLVDYVVNAGNATPTVGEALIRAKDDATNGGAYGPVFFGIDPGYVTLLPDIDIGTTTCLDAMQNIASWDVNGILTEWTNLALDYTSYRFVTTPAWSFPTSGVFTDWSVSQELANTGNIQSVSYNVSQSTTIRDSASVSTYGAFQQSRTMQCDSSADAYAGANAYLLSYGTPWPIVTGVGFDLSSVPAAALFDVMNTQVNTVVDTSGPAAYIPGLPDLCVVEGWTEVIRRHTWTIRYNLSDIQQTLRPETWSSVTPTLTWSAVPGTVTWRSMISGSL